MPCLHALGLRDLARLHARSVRQLVVAEAPCEGCARATGSRLEHAVGEFHQLALDHDHEPLVLRHVSPQDWQRGLAANDLPGGLPHVGRRGLLKSVLEAFSGQAGTRPAARRGDEPSSRLALFVPDIDGTRCTGCEACVRICPHGALKMDGYSGVGWSYRIIAANCTGCRLCVDICDEDAVTLERMTRQRRSAVHLVARRCTRCGAPFAEPEERGAHDSVCRICRRVDHSRKLFQVLE
ncbi:MAG: 4Fe-4S binding protein [Hyphomicrobiales bacterium]